GNLLARQAAKPPSRRLACKPWRRSASTVKRLFSPPARSKTTTGRARADRATSSAHLRAIFGSRRESTGRRRKFVPPTADRPEPEPGRCQAMDGDQPDGW